MLETINRQIDLLEPVETGLDKRFSDMGKATDASLRVFRVPLQTEMGGGFGAFNSDGGAYPQGLGPSYDQGVMTPYEFIVATTFTELAQRIGASGTNVSIVNPVDIAIGNMQKKMAIKRNMLLQGSNNGIIATINAAYAGGGANPVSLATDPFGGRLINLHDTVQVLNKDTYALRGTAFVTDISNKSAGATDTVTFDEVPAGTVAGDFLAVPGVAAGTPLFFNGLQYIVSPSAVGEYLNISRANSYVQAPAYNAGSVDLGLGIILAFLTRMMQPLGVEAFQSQRTKNFWYLHPAQMFAYQARGFNEQAWMINGTAPKFDGVPSPFGQFKIAGIEAQLDSVAAISKMYFLDQSSMVRCRYSKGPQMLPGPLNGMYWPRVSGATHLTQNDVYFYDASNFATKNPWANGVIYGLAIPGALQV